MPFVATTLLRQDIFYKNILNWKLEERKSSLRDDLLKSSALVPIIKNIFLFLSEPSEFITMVGLRHRRLFINKFIRQDYSLYNYDPVEKLCIESNKIILKYFREFIEKEKDPELLQLMLNDNLEKHFFTRVVSNAVYDDNIKSMWDKKEKNGPEVRYWQIAPAQQARLWEDLLKNSIAAVGFSEVDVDLTNFSKNNLIEVLHEKYPNFENRKLKLKSRQLTNFLNLKAGDKIVSNKGLSYLLGLGVVKKGYSFRPERQELKHTVDVDYYKVSEKGIPIPEDLRGKFGKTIVPLSKDEFDRIEKLFDGDSQIQTLRDYKKSDALKDLFISEKDFDYVMSRLKSKKNIILQGPPGVGKTFIAKRIAYYLMGLKDDTRISMVQFHQSYSYEDFIQGFRPNDDGKFTLRNGLFYEFCQNAIQDSDHKYIFIIDEINRGNLSKIFGEMLMLIEADKRGQLFAVPLTYGKGNSDTFHIPENLYLIGTMNTADRSLAMVDYALRRRFSFIDLEPQFRNIKFRQNLEAARVHESLITLIIERMEALNQTISEDTKNLGPGYRVGHSYFCPIGNDNPYDETWYRMVVKSEIEPLLREYWFDDPKRVAGNVGKLLAGIPE